MLNRKHAAMNTTSRTDIYASCCDLYLTIHHLHMLTILWLQQWLSKFLCLITLFKKCQIQIILLPSTQLSRGHKHTTLIIYSKFILNYITKCFGQWYTPRISQPLQQHLWFASDSPHFSISVFKVQSSVTSTVSITLYSTKQI